MLSAEVVNLLNEQVKKEMFASNLYLNMSSWCYKNHFDGAGEFLFAHAEEERDHATKLIKYLNDTDSKAVIDTIAKPESEFDSLLDVFEKIYTHELSITESITNLVDFTLSKKDFSTFNFLQWYVSEQHEEEALFRSILDKIKLIGEASHGPYLADEYIKSLVK